MNGSVTGVRSIDIDVSSLTDATRFYRDVWNLTVVETSQSCVHLRATCPAHHVLALHQSIVGPVGRWQMMMAALQGLGGQRILGATKPGQDLAHPVSMATPRGSNAKRAHWTYRTVCGEALA
jgi:hypothetical protein